MSAPCERAAYEAGGWNDGRLGHAYNLIAEILAERGEEAREHPLLTQIDMLDEQCRPEAMRPKGDPHATPVELKPWRCVSCKHVVECVDEPGGCYICLGITFAPVSQSTRPPASAAPVDELVERINRHADVLEGIPRTAGLVADMCQAADQLTIYARRVAGLAGALRKVAAIESDKEMDAEQSWQFAVDVARAALTGEQG